MLAYQDITRPPVRPPLCLPSRCRFQGCRKVVKMIVMVELAPGVLERPVCGDHSCHAQALARHYDAIAYRLIPV